ncbi:putative uncharacterized protein [Bacteroides sp. CAG:189]|nr:hypothetical protein [Bacteroides sp. CAG:189]CCY49622.1 putative uncharacterized protein [Bacteroides sp. CAG:189]
MFGVIAPTVRAGIKALCKSGVLKEYGIERLIRLSDRSSIEVYDLETIAVLAFRIESFGATKVRKVLLERITHRRKEKTTVIGQKQHRGLRPRNDSRPRFPYRIVRGGESP